MFQINSFRILERAPCIIWELQAIKNYLRITHEYDDSLLNSLLEAATDAAEKFTNLKFQPTLVEFKTNNKVATKFSLKYAPIIAIRKIKLNDQILETDNYFLNIDKQELQLQSLLKHGVLEVEYLAGFNEESIPAALKHGILLHIAAMYDREQIGDAIPDEVACLYASYRKLRV